MSIAARDWALCQDLKPVPKFVLVVLADAANTHGVCWPRISTIARKVGVSSRTVQRAIQLLIQRDLITAEQRYRSDGSCSSNLYRLLLKGGDNLSPTPDRGGGDNSDLVYPKALLPAERSRAEAMIATLAAPLNQQVLDEWAGIITAGDIRSSLLGCLRALIKRAQVGTFTPERALHVAQARKACQRMETAQAHVELPTPGPIDKDSPLVRRMMDIAQRSCRK